MALHQPPPPPDCAYARPIIGRQSPVACAIGLHGGLPHRGVCRNCTARVSIAAPDVAAEIARLERLMELSPCANFREGLAKTIARMKTGRSNE